MSVKIIQTRTDPVVFKLRGVRDGRDHSHVFCEGEKLVIELIESGWRPTGLYCSKESQTVAKNLLVKHKIPAVPIIILSEPVMRFCSDMTTPPGLIALAKPSKLPDDAKAASSAVPLLLILHGVQLPQNVGALLRTSEAVGVTEVISTPRTADVFGPKALRGSMGSAFRLPVKKGFSLADILKKIKLEKITSVAAMQNGIIPYDRFDWLRPTALVVGSESAGLTDEEAKQFDATVAIPMKGRVESLNVGTAAAVCLFEAARQRRGA